MGYGSAVHSGSRWEKSAAQSETGPVTISLRVPADPRSRLRQRPSAERLSLAISEPLNELDRLLGTVQPREAGVVLLARRHGAVAQDRPVALIVLTEQAGRKVVAATVPLAGPRVDLYLHWDIPSSVRQWRITTSI